MFHKMLLTGFFSLSFLFLFSQNENEAAKRELLKLPIPPTPNAAALGKFGDIPVGLSTGVPSVDIPFFNYANALKGLSLDVGLSYHAGGHKVEDMPSNCGLGWSLQAGGMVSRTVRGRPDDAVGGYLNTGPLPYYYTSKYDPRYLMPVAAGTMDGITITNSSDYTLIKSIVENGTDGECDIFQFSAGSLSGKFFLDKSGNVHLFAQSNVKVSYEREPNSSGQYIKSFSIVDDKGVSYIFDQFEFTESVNSLASDPNSFLPEYISTWYLSKIISLDKKDTISFNYTLGNNIVYESGFSESRKARHIDEVLSGPVTYTHSYNTILTRHAKRLSSIDFPEGAKLFFGYTFPRQDYVGDFALTSVSVKTEGFEKRFELSYDYFESDVCNTGDPSCSQINSTNNYYKRLKLTQVLETDGATALPPYTFEYNSTKLPPRNSKAQDFWGYYNAQVNNTLIPAIASTPFGPLSGANRNPSETHTKAWVLEKIYYPTGGHTRLYYGLNKGVHNGVVKEAGGLRVEKTENFEPNTGSLINTNYTYQFANGTTSGELQTLPNYFYYETGMWHTTTGQVDLEWPEYYISQSSTPNQSLNYLQGSPVLYARVKVDKDNNGASNGYTVHEFTSFPEILGANDNYPYTDKQSYDWKQGLPLKVLTYNTSNQLVKAVENQYQYFHSAPLTGQTLNLNVGVLYHDNLNTPTYNLYGVRAHQLGFGRSELTSSKEIMYENGIAILETTANYTYDANRFLVKKVQSANSKGELLETRYYYPFDYSTTGLNAVGILIASNCLNLVVSEESWKKMGATWFLTGAVANDYNGFNKTKIITSELSQPLSETILGAFNPNVLKRHASYNEQVEILKHDALGRYLEVSKLGQPLVSFLWPSKGQSPFAQVTNARSNEIFFESFEESGGWDNILTAYDQTRAHTGKRSGKLEPPVSGPESITHRNEWMTVSLTGATKFTYSGWIYSAAQSAEIYFLMKTENEPGYVTYHDHVTTTETNKWVYVQKEFLVPADVKKMSLRLDNNGGGTVWFDDLRLHPSSAQMISYTHDPVLGITSTSDVNSRPTTYEYDGLGRLYLVKDEEGRILKKYCYNYKGQVENCSGIANTPSWQKTGPERCKPCAGGGNYISNLKERQEIDTNPNSPTYNTTRWVDDGASANCVPQADFQIIDIYCQQNSQGAYTGNQVVIKKDKNPCSPTFNHVTTTIVYNPQSCIAACGDCIGADKKCLGNQCETGIKVYTASVFNPSTNKYDCTYHYEWSDGSWSQNYTEESLIECPIL